MLCCTNLSWEDTKKSLGQFADKSSPIILSRVLAIGSEFAITKVLLTGDTDHLAASGLINILLNVVLRTGMNVLYPTGIMVSREAKGDAKKTIGEILNSSYLVAIGLSIVFIPPLAFSSTILKSIGQPTTACSLTEIYFRNYLWGIPALLLSTSSRQICYNLKEGWASFAICSVRRALYMSLSYFLFHGTFGLPKMGIAGIGFANGISVWVDQILFTLYFALKKSFKPYGIFTYESIKSNILNNMWEIIRDGAKMGADAINDFIVNFISMILVGLKGAGPLSAAEVALLFKRLLSIPIIGMSQGNSFVLRAEKNLSKRRTQATFNTLVSLTLPVLFCTACFAVSNPLISLFIHPEDSTTFSLAQHLLWIVLGTMIPYDIHKMISSSYRGSQQYLLPLIVNVGSTAVFGLGMAGLLDYFTSLSSEGVFLGVTAGSTLGAFLMSYFWGRKLYLPTREEEHLNPSEKKKYDESMPTEQQPGIQEDENVLELDGSEDAQISCSEAGVIEPTVNSCCNCFSFFRQSKKQDDYDPIDDELAAKKNRCCIIV